MDEMKEMVMAMVLARLQAQGKSLASIDDAERQVLINEAIEDLMLAKKAIDKNRVK